MAKKSQMWTQATTLHASAAFQPLFDFFVCLFAADPPCFAFPRYSDVAILSSSKEERRSRWTHLASQLHWKEATGAVRRGTRQGSQQVFAKRRKVLGSTVDQMEPENDF